MWKKGKIAAGLLALFLCMSPLALMASTGSTQSPLAVTTDKTEYSAGEEIRETITIRNTTGKTMTSIALTGDIPEGYVTETAKDANGKWTLSLDALEAGDSKDQVVVFIGDGNVSSAGTSATGTPSAETSATGTPSAETSATGTPSAETSATGTPSAETSATGTPSAETSATGTSSAGTSATGNTAIDSETAGTDSVHTISEEDTVVPQTAGPSSDGIAPDSSTDTHPAGIVVAILSVVAGMSILIVLLGKHRWKKFITFTLAILMAVSVVRIDRLCVSAAEIAANEQSASTEITVGGKKITLNVKAAYQLTETKDDSEMEQHLSYEGYTLKWEDDFNGTELNRDDWNVELHDPGWVNSELQEYVDSTDNIYVEDGNLVIKPIKTDNGDGTYSYTSGRVNTQGKHDFTYGLFEARVKVPAGTGYLPAFWMMPTDENLYGQWPRCGEIDCMEVMGQENNKLYGTIHYGNPHSESQGTYTLSEGNFTDEYHTFSCEWEPGKISWYVDGILYHTEDDWYSTTVGQGTVTYPAPFDQPFYMILNLAVGGSWVGYPDETTDFDNAAYVIDYVKVYQKDSYDENVTKPVKDVTLRDSDANGNYINNGDFAVAESLTDDADWKFMTALEGEATAEITDQTMIIRTTNAGTVDYSVQLVQAGVPLEKGATYEVSFSAKADAARSTNVAVKAPDRGYQTYMSENADLTTEYQNYSFTFKMTSDSDANGRLEYNMGAAGSTATIYIKDVAIKKIADADPNEVETKVALTDGNFVYNGSFREGDNRLGYWTVSDGMKASVTDLKDGRRLKAEVTTAGATVSQDALAILDGTTYALSFDAQAYEGASATVTVAGVEKNFALATETKNYTATITIPQGASDKDFSIRFNGAGTYYIDNVRLVEDALIKNGSFDAGTSGYEIYLYNTADASYVVDSQQEDNALDLTIKNTNDADWKIQVKQDNVTLEEGKYYRLSFDIKSSIARSFTYAIQRDGSDHTTADGNEDWTPYVQETVNLEAYGADGTYTHIEKCFRMDYETDAESIFNIALGGGNNTTQHRVCIDNISLVEIDASEMPEEPEKPDNQTGNLLTNGDFSDGDTGWSGEVQQKAAGNWNFDNGAAKVVITSLGDAAINGSESWHVNLKQKGLTLEAGCTYEVTATITSTVDRTAEFACMDASSAKWYVMGDNKFTLSANNPTTVTFTVGVGENSTDKSAYIGFNLGKISADTPDTGTIEIDDVTMVLVNGDAGEIEGNGTEADKTEGGENPDTPENLVSGFKEDWSTWVSYATGDSGSAADRSFEDNKAVVAITNVGSEDYHVALEYKEMLKLENGKTYRVTVNVNATTARTIKASFMNPDYDWYGGADIALQEGDNQVSFDFTVSKDTTDNITFKFSLGQIDASAEETGTFTFTDVTLSVVE